MTERSKPEPVALFFADSHLDQAAWSSRPTLRGDSQFSFQYIVDKAIELGVDHIVGAGDLIDVKKPDTATARFLRRQISRLQSAQIDFYFTQGQHEYSLPPWLKALHNWPTWSHQKWFSIRDDAVVYCIDWTPADMLQDELAKVPEHTDILVMHQVWDEFMGEIRGCEGSWSHVPYASVLFTGDYHDTHYLEGDKGRAFVGANGQPLTVISPGSTNLRKVDEPEAKHFFLLFSDWSWRKCKIPTRHVLRPVLSDDDDLEDFLSNSEKLISKHCELAEQEGLPPGLFDPIVHVTYPEDLDNAFKRLRRTLAGQGAHFFHKAIPIETPEIVVSRQRRQEVVERGLTGCLELLVPKDDYDYAPLYRLLSSSDPRVVLKEMRDERFNPAEVSDAAGRD